MRVDFSVRYDSICQIQRPSHTRLVRDHREDPLSGTYDFDLVCIGSGPAGQRAAVQAAKVGRKVAVLEKKKKVGGVSLDTGTIPSKTFREAVLSFRGTASELGLTGAFSTRDRPPPAQELLQRVGEVIDREAVVIQHQLHRNDVELIRGTASFVAPHTLRIEAEDGARTLTADKILIAVGTRPSAPPGAPADGNHIITSDGVLRLQTLPRVLAVVGGGVVGIEYASMFAALGCEVTLVERRKRPLEFMDSEIVDELIQQMRQMEVTFRLGEAVESLEVREDSARKAVLHLESGKRIASDLILFSIARVGATEALNLEAVGLEADERGRLQVGDDFQTRVSGIYAAGDVIGHPSLAATSSEQGRLAACHALGVECHPMPSHLPIGIYAIPELSMVGATEEELTEKKIPYETGVARYREIARGQILKDDSGFLKMLFHREDRHLLGVHIIGTGATELVHIGQAVLRLKGGLDYFLDTVFNYPTLAECYKVAALDASNKLAL